MKIATAFSSRQYWHSNTVVKQQSRVLQTTQCYVAYRNSLHPTDTQRFDVLITAIILQW